MHVEKAGISNFTLRRLPNYLAYLKSLPEDGPPNISATAIAAAMGLGEVQVRKDLAAASGAGRPRTGYQVSDLIRDLEHFLGYGRQSRAVLVGAGHLGLALLSYSGFADYGLDIVAAFDRDEALVGTKIGEKPIFPVGELPDFCRRENILIGILTVPAWAAQSCCDMLVKSGVRAVWNFAPVHLAAPKEVLIQRENMASSLALLSCHLRETEQGAENESNDHGGFCTGADIC